ncbi:hypothetical protein PVAP13_1KG191554 [Panicum virgatum]|uniref:Uncharacterized protein n=1 Tax=Panicum virgatum TaxID=38727 RepID=A0A8T0XIU9_PANVG|nr:hypothetical protein PVAP13_1KG191554 [Panicum virgatum]
MSSGVSCHSSLPPPAASSAAAPPVHAAAGDGGETFLALAPARAAMPAVAAPRGDDSVEAEVGGLGLGLHPAASARATADSAGRALPAASAQAVADSTRCALRPAAPAPSRTPPAARPAASFRRAPLRTLPAAGRAEQSREREGGGEKVRRRRCAGERRRGADACWYRERRGRVRV